MERKKRRFKFAVGLLISLHFFGLLGMHLPIMDELLQQLTPFESFLSLTPLNLILTAFLLFYFHEDWNTSFLLFFIFTFLIGFIVEVLGVKTGVVFGEYYYGEILGFKLAEVPILIGVNWLVLAYATGILSRKITSNFWVSVSLGAAMMTTLDWIIEPVAIQLGFWTWTHGDIPLLNFCAWFVISWVICALFMKLKFQKENKMAYWVLACQSLFFIAQQVLFSVN